MSIVISIEYDVSSWSTHSHNKELYTLKPVSLKGTNMWAIPGRPYVMFLELKLIFYYYMAAIFTTLLGDFRLIDLPRSRIHRCLGMITRLKSVRWSNW